MKDNKVILDIPGTLLDAGKQAINAVIIAATIALVIVVALVCLFAATAAYLLVLGVIGAIIAHFYIGHPKFTSVLTVLVSTIASILFFVNGMSVVGFAVALLAFYGLLILPPAGLEYYKIRRKKMFAISIRSVIQLMTAGVCLGVGLLIASNPKLDTPEGDERAWAVPFFALAGFAFYRGVINANRQKNYLIDPSKTIQDWTEEEYQKSIKYLQKNHPSLLPEKRRLKPKSKVRLAPAPWKRKIGEKVKFAGQVLEEVRSFGPG